MSAAPLPSPGPPRVSGRQICAVVLVLLAAVTGGWTLRPRPPRLGDRAAGDAALAAAVRASIGDPRGYRGLSVALVDGEAIRFAQLGESGTDTPIDPGLAFEIGSIGKVFTGMLLADLVQQGSVRADEPLRAFFPEIEFSDPDLRDRSLAELASHRAGLASVPYTGSLQRFAGLFRFLRGGDPYRGRDLRWLEAQLGDVAAAAGTPRVRYSNFGMALLGQALARRERTTYVALVEQRILEPLALHATSFHLDGAPLPQRRARGSRETGSDTDAWQGSAYAPAGAGAWSTAGDLASLLVALLRRSAPGLDALTPRFAAEPSRSIGYAWFTDRVGDRAVTWHDGATAGFRAYVGIDPERGRGAVVLGNTSRSVAAIGRALILGEGGGAFPPARPAEIRRARRVALLSRFATCALSLLGGVSALFESRRRRTDRMRLASVAVWSIALLVLAHRVGTWLVLPDWLFAAGVGLSTLGVLAAARRWPRVPVTHPDRWPVGTAASGLSILIALAVIAGLRG